MYYEDEADIHFNSKIGSDWQLRGQQKRVVTPGQNEKYYLAGALHSGTGKVSYVGGGSEGLALFISLLKHLKATYRRARTITLIVDNYIIHKSQQTLRWLKQNPKFKVVYQPVYSPWINHVNACGWRYMTRKPGTIIAIRCSSGCKRFATLWISPTRSWMETLSGKSVAVLKSAI